MEMFALGDIAWAVTEIAKDATPSSIVFPGVKELCNCVNRRPAGE